MGYWNEYRGPVRVATWTAATLSLLAAVVACGGGNGVGTSAAPSVATLTCATIQSDFKPDNQTTVVLVKEFKQGDALTLASTVPPGTATAANDLCLVKLNVGPGNPGPAGAPSTSTGIGIEIWLPTPANWNQRLHALGGGGWAGGTQGSATEISNSPTTGLAPADVAGIEGAISASTDAGHADSLSGGAFMLKPDRSINTALAADYSVRSLHELAVKTKALAKSYYGAEPKYSYWHGFSTGGRQGLKLAQVYPEDFNGIVAGSPAINLFRFQTAQLYPQLLFQRELGGVPLTTGQQDLVSNAAIAACDLVGGQHLGYLLDPSACTYDPTTDSSVICTSAGGASTSPDCVTQAQALVVNKIWYGLTRDGSVPSPAVDNGWGSVPSGNHLWYGNTRGTSLYWRNGALIGLNGLASPTTPFIGGPDQLAINMQDPELAQPTFRNAYADGANGWRNTTYAQLGLSFDRGIDMQAAFAYVDTDNPDLSAFKAKGGKLIHYHGLSDEGIYPQGSIRYYDSVLAAMGGASEVQKFYRFMLVPGMSHLVIVPIPGFYNGSSNLAANPPAPTPTQMYDAVVAWVEQGTAPDAVTVSTAPGTTPTRTQTLCLYPKKVTYVSGDINVAASYTCQ